MPMTPIPPAAKTVAWVQHLLLNYLFTYTYLFSLNIISNLLSAYNKDQSLDTINNWLLNFLAEFNISANISCLPLRPLQTDFHLKILSIFLPYKI